MTARLWEGHSQVSLHASYPRMLPQLHQPDPAHLSLGRATHTKWLRKAAVAPALGKDTFTVKCSGVLWKQSLTPLLHVCREERGPTLPPTHMPSSVGQRLLPAPLGRDISRLTLDSTWLWANSWLSRWWGKGIGNS